MRAGDATTGRQRAWVVVAVAVIGLLGLPSCAGAGAPAAQGPGAGEADDGDGAGGAPQMLADPADRQALEPRPLLELVSAGGVGRLYTLDQQEALTAVARFGMRLEPGQVGHLPRRELRQGSGCVAAPPPGG